MLSDWDAEVAPSLREFQGTAESIGGDVSCFSRSLHALLMREGALNKEFGIRVYGWDF